MYTYVFKFGEHFKVKRVCKYFRFWRSLESRRYFFEFNFN